MSKLSINRYGDQCCDHISKFPSEILARILNFFDVRSATDASKISPEGKQLIKFWIACTTDTRLYQKINVAMFVIDVPICLVKNLNSDFARYVTDMSFYGRKSLTISSKRNTYANVSTNITFEEFRSTLAAVSKRQYTRSRVRCLDVEHVNLDDIPEHEDRFDALSELYGDFVQVTDILIRSSFNSHSWGHHGWDILKILPNVRCIDANYQCVDHDGDTYPKVQEIRNIGISGASYFSQFFPNLIRLTLCGDVHQKRHIDLSGLKFLQEFGWYNIDPAQIKRPGKILELTLFGENLRKLSINKSVHVNVISGGLDKLEFFEIDGSEIVDFLETDSAAINLHHKMPNLKHLVIEHMNGDMLKGLANFAQITHLEIKNTIFYNETLKHVGCIRGLKRLSRLALVNVQSVAGLAIWSTLFDIEYLTWIGVTEFVGSPPEARVLPPIRSMRKLKYLKMELIEVPNLEDLVYALCEVENLHIINPSISMRIRSDIDPSIRFSKQAVHTEEFLSWFHALRLDLLKEKITESSFVKSFCKRLIFESATVVKTNLSNHNAHVKKLHSEFLQRTPTRKIYNFMLLFIHRQIEM
jgi:hypothetical protein